MKNLIGIIAGDPESINSEIIAKAWKKKSQFANINIFIIGNFKLINQQLKSLGFSIKTKKINDIEKKNFKKNLLIYDIPLKFVKPFKIPKAEKSKYVLKSFDLAVALAKKKEISGLINCPINKKDIFRNKNIGITEFLSNKLGTFKKEVMLIYNKTLSVSPITTHIKIRKVHSKITKKRIISNVITINNFLFKKLCRKPKIGILGLNPHNDELRKDSEEKKIIVPAINYLKKRKLHIDGPLSPDTAFLNYKKDRFNVIVGMYHDQVLSPYKSIFKFNAINVTLGLPFLRVSPDHGTGRNIIRRNIANPKSLIEAIKFFKRSNVKT